MFVSRYPAPRPAVFLDRDGVIVEECGYLHCAEEVRYIPGALATIVTLNRAGIPVVVVTNQGGIGRGLYPWEGYQEVQERIVRDLVSAGGWLDGVWACAASEPEHPFRKPNPGMFRSAAADLNLDIGRSWMVGDKPLDIEAAFRAGLAGVCHVATGYGSETRPEVSQIPRTYGDSTCMLICCESLVDAGRLIKEALVCQ
jgi:D-glycero-D-manno-heptose 1,7-bisphosphate phosphatase